MCVAMSKEFLQGMHLDANKIFNEGMSMMENPSLRLEEKEIATVRSGLEIVTRVLNSDSPYKREALLSLLSSTATGAAIPIWYASASPLF